jgi:TRAP-type C4-dicarboxylate transport system substrate-binding protein
VRALGATPVALAFGEMYPALQSKVMDGVELVYNNIPGGRFYEVLKYVSETHHIMLVNYEVISSKWFNALPANYQKILVEECDKAGIETSKLIMEKLEKEVKADLIKRGMIVVDDVDIAAFRKAGEKAYEVLKIADAKAKVHKEIGKK